MFDRQETDRWPQCEDCTEAGRLVGKIKNSAGLWSYRKEDDECVSQIISAAKKLRAAGKRIRSAKR